MNSLEYNTERTKLIIPEYGRHVHQMIDQAVALKDKDERNKMAKAIIDAGGSPKITFYENTGHVGGWENAFAEKDFLKWIHSKSKKQ
jgi:hypothetical protein